jgi:PAS domain S-box-containing protein/putative nucleotidyltransferase with HDIG domain
MSERLRVLVVEDNPADVDLIRDYMSGAGFNDFHIDIASSLSEAIARLEKDTFDLLLIDLGLPDSQGLETYLRLQKIVPNLPVIILTGLDDEDAGIAAVRNGAQDYLIKNQMAGNLLMRSAQFAVERKRAEEALRNSETKLKYVQEVAQIGSWEFDLDNQTIQWSDRVYKLYDRDPAIGPPTVEEEAAYYSHKQADRLREYTRIAVEQGRSFEYDLEVRLPRRRVTHYAATLRPIKNRSGRIAKLFGTVQDISESKRAETALKKSEERFKLIFEHAPDAYYLSDLKGKFIDGNRAAETITGYKRDELIGGCFLKLDLLSSDQLPKAATLLAKNVMGKSTGPDEFILKKKSGEKVAVEISTHPIKIENKSVVLGIARDITEHKKADKMLQESEEKYRNLAENAGEAIIIAQDGMLKFVNQAASKMSGYSRQELCFSPFIELVHPDDRQMVSERYSKRIERTEFIPQYEFRLINRAGKIKWVDIYGIKVTWEGKPAALGFLNDISESKQAEEALRTSEAQLSNALKMAHAGHWEYDVARDTFTFNDNFYRIFRTTAAEAGGYQMSSADYARRFCHPEDAALVGEEIRAAIESSDPNYGRQLEHRILYADGEVGTISVRFFIVKDAQGRTVKTCGVNQDITDRKQMEEALRQAEENFRRSMDESPLGIRIVSAEGETLFANRAILDIYGYDDIEELRSTPVNKRYTPESYSEFQLREKRRMNGEDYSSEYEISIIRKMGEIRHLLVFRKEILWDGKKQFQAIYQDITERKKAEKELEKTLDGLRNAISGIIHVLSATTEKRDPYTAGHQKRVADLARAIAQEMGLPAEQVEGLRLAGTIHDIGKVAIPAEILSKPTRLTEIEYALIQSHPQVGHDILREIDFVWPIAEMILQHHERMNGSGYPRGLKDGEILLEARIIAVADVVEAMISHRPYRPALGLEKALEEIMKNAGRLYDEDVVKSCVRLFREKEFQL